MEDLTVPVPGGEVSVWHRPPEGSASTAVLVHGLSGNARWWGGVIDRLPADLGIIALDVRGRGDSTDAPPPFDLETIAEDITRSLDHLGVARAIVAGYSMGAWIVALFGLHHPDRVERLVLVDGGLTLPRAPGADADAIIEAVVGPSLARLGLEFDTEEAFFDYWKAHPALAEHWDDDMRPALGHELEPANGRFRVRANPEAIQVAAREITVGETANEAVARLEIPAHLIVVEKGTADQPPGMIPLQVAEEATAANPALTLEYLPGVNHYTLALGAGAPAVAAAIAGS